MLGDEKASVLKNICFQVKRGEYVAILGPSGSGRITLMNVARPAKRIVHIIGGELSEKAL